MAVSLEMPGRFDTVGNYQAGSADFQINYVDMWGINHYPGHSFTDFFARYANLSEKPLVITLGSLIDEE
jgi:hypothetical protein